METNSEGVSLLKGDVHRRMAEAEAGSERPGY
jgi:hypothetical protein